MPGDRSTIATPRIRPLTLPADAAHIAALTDDHDLARSPALEGVLRAGDAFGFVVDDGAGFVLVHTVFRPVYGWVVEPDTATLMSGSSAYLEVIAVAAPHRGRGRGTALLRAATAQAIARGKRRMYLHVRQSNDGAIRLYERAGWTHLRTGQPAWMDVPMCLYAKDLG